LYVKRIREEEENRVEMAHGPFPEARKTGCGLIYLKNL